MLNKLCEWLHELNMIPCKCGCKDDHWIVKDTISGHVCEAEIICDKCGKVVNYWAYGSTEFPETYTKLISERLAKFADYLDLRHQYRIWKFKRLVKRNSGGF